MQKKHQALWGYLFISPQFLGLLCFSLLPLLYALYLSFVNWDGFGITVIVVTAMLISAFMTAYAFAKIRFPGSD
ncbi:ABC-type sugar transport system permease subunit [Paenibacillus sp. RC73]